MNQAKAFANNDVVLLVWNYENPIDNCLGFCIKRKDMSTNKEVILESMVGFKKDSIQTRQFKPTSVWPIQKFNWRDFSAERGATYVYTIIPMIGTSTDLSPKTQAKVVTNQVTVSPGTGKIKAYFNRGILSTQFVSSQIPKSQSGIPDYSILLSRIEQPGDSLRNKLAGQLREAVMSLLNKAIQEGGECFCALYELNDPELIAKLLEAKDRVHLILSNAGVHDETNQVVRSSLHDSGMDVIDRMLSSGHIGHNKFVLYVDPQGTPTTVMTGGTNWTYTGLCAESNNTIIIESNELADYYMDYWNRLQADDSQQGHEFRADNNQQREVQIGQTDISLWFAPNTRLKNKTANSPTPSDMAQVFEVMNAAQKSILFLAFKPGSPSIIGEAEQIELANPNLFIRGAVNDLEAVDDFRITLYHRGIKDPVIVAPEEIRDDFSYWMAELLKSSPAGHAMIHDKIMVIDAFTDDCVVITGSHNLGYRASYNNDENLLIIKGNKELATSYATHILDIYDHYRWRYFLYKNYNSNRFEGLSTKPNWQDKYFDNERDESIDTRFWL